MGVIFSRDYVRLKPFVSLSALVVKGEINQDRLRANVDNTSWRSTLHASIGTEIELPVNMTAQLDFFNLAVGGSVFVGKKF